MNIQTKPTEMAKWRCNLERVKRNESKNIVIVLASNE